MKPKLAAYFRVSSKAQKEDQTIHRQKHNFEFAWKDLAKEYELFEKIPRADGSDRYFIDEGFNLETWDESTDFYRLIQFCQRGEVQAVFVSEADRLFRSRSNELRGRILDIIRDHNIAVITKAGVISTNSIVMEFMSSLSAEDKRGILRKCHDGKITRLQEEGRPPTGRVPFGFSYDKKSKEWSLVALEIRLIKAAVSLSLGKIIDPELPSEIKMITSQNPSGLNDKEVAQELNRLGFAKRSTFHINHRAKREMTSSSIEVLFREDRYRGFIEFNMIRAELVGNQRKKEVKDRDKYRVPVPRALSDQVWFDLQSKRESRRKLAKKNQSYEYLVKDLLVCVHCGTPLSARPKHTVRILRSGERVEYAPTLYYVCARKPKVDGSRCFASRCHSAPIIDSLIWEKTSLIFRQPQAVQEILKASDLNRDYESRRNAIKTSIIDGQGRIESLAQKIEINRKQWIRSLIDENEYASTVTAIKEHMEVERRCQARLQQELAALRPDNSIATLTKMIQSVDFSKSYEFSQRRELIFQLFDKISISTGGEINLVLTGGLSIEL